jgi:UDP-N-acetyl-D-galactosamine dehydrogenase
MNSSKLKLAIVGLGYVGLPLAIEFGKTFNDVFGFDISKKRIDELNLFSDSTGEISSSNIKRATKLKFSNNLNEIKNCNCYIIAVPTPVNKKNIPDLRILISASKLVAKVLKKNDVVIYESTVYPGATEEVCVPVLEEFSLLKFNKDFYIGYSPERINPGDKKHTIKNIIKIVAGSTPQTTDFVSDLYSSIVRAGIYRVSSIKTAEAAKIIENTQRDLNIALVNELSIIFQKLNLDTEEVLKAAETKWNFNSFRPGLVGGHCIGVDPYYLAHKALTLGYNPKIILSGRNLNNQMTKHVAKNFLNILSKKKINLAKSKVLIMGITFKENVPDVRNTKIIDLIKLLKKTCSIVDVYDPVADYQEVKKIYGLSLKKKINQNTYHGIVLAVKHKQFVHMGIKKIRKFGVKNRVIYDLKYLFPLGKTDVRL